MKGIGRYVRVGAIVGLVAAMGGCSAPVCTDAREYYDYLDESIVAARAEADIAQSDYPLLLGQALDEYGRLLRRRAQTVSENPGCFTVEERIEADDGADWADRWFGSR